MNGKQDPDNEPTPPSELDKIVAEVVSEANLQAGALRQEERDYLKEHALKKPLGVLHIWALGVGVVITGEYFGWNQGLKEGGPIGMLLATLFVCALSFSSAIFLILELDQPYKGFSQISSWLRDTSSGDIGTGGAPMPSMCQP